MNEWMTSNPLLSTFLMFAALWFAFQFLIWPFRLINRWFRHRNIAAKGWPPPYLDADGDKVELG